ncbi:MAG: glycoside hydrolase family 38 C-terminal domain-containing protein, partial [Clostridia bacterium]|nr:glycoside hydrolase family 38 C-terminal domain-containing protein [Clostridia bacterium]MDY5554813.1 glycoside hydrolase family 38 C-terminal domain-containing protein [Blautia sp.]
ELYLEYHRGTYTTMAKNKRYNRKSEFAYENLEFYSVLAGFLAGVSYPEKELYEGWETILRNQFHDIIPGSSIKEVYEESWKEYEKILGTAALLIEKMTQATADALPGDAGDIVIFNPNSGCAPCVVRMDRFPEAMTALESEGHRYPVQKTQDGCIVVVDNVPGHGCRVFKPVSGSVNVMKDFTITEQEVDTLFFHFELNKKGQFVSIYDKKAGRELLQEGKAGNVLMTYEDRPHNYDAWDINIYYTEKSWEVDETSEIKVIENGPVRGCIRVIHPYGESQIVQYLYFYPDQYRFDIRNEVDWQEDHVLLRGYFPVDIHTNEATYEIQYGNVKRATHDNTSWDMAKFEVCAHKWLDVSEDDYGISVLNDCKYGYSVRDSVIGLTMLKSPDDPNPKADRGHHSFSYSFCPHSGDFRSADTVSRAYAFNNPCLAVMKQKEAVNSSESVFSFVSVNVPGVVIETVKKAEDSDSLIIRCYECFNRRNHVKMEINGEFDSCSEVNMLENEVIQELKYEDGTAEFDIKPFEIKTLKFDIRS